MDLWQKAIHQRQKNKWLALYVKNFNQKPQTSKKTVQYNVTYVAVY